MKEKNLETGRASIFIIMMTLLIVLFSSIANGQQTKVLFLGNSFTYTYDIPDLFNDLAVNAGEDVFIDEYVQAGIAVYDDQVTGHVNDPAAQAKISSEQWDFIIIQDNMGGWVYDFIASGPGNANVTLYNQIKSNNSCTRLVYFAAWGPEGGVPQLGYPNETTQSCNNRIFENLTSFNDQAADEIVSPVGKAWNQSLYDLPGVDLFHSDNVHPSLEGSYLAALTLFSTVFKTDPSGLTYNGGVSNGTATTMKSIAWNTVMDPVLFDECNLDKYTPTITQSDDDLSSSGFTSYQWFLNGNAISGATTALHTATETGTYYVIGYDSDGCPSYSMTHEVTNIVGGGDPGVGISENEKDYNKVFPNPANEVMNISIENHTDKIIITDMSGKVIIEQKVEFENQINIDVSGWEQGVYLVQSISSMNGTFLQKVVID